jgi:GT2 family glycosyltransferase
MRSHGVSIVIPTWDGLDLIQQFLPSVLGAANSYIEIAGGPVEVMVIDDGSTDGTVDWLLAQGFTSADPAEKQAPVERPSEGSAPALRVIHKPVNEGFGAACNLGFSRAIYPLVFLVNNDVELDTHSIAPLVENFHDGSLFAAHCRVFDLRSGRECGTGKLGSFSRGFVRVHRSWKPTASPASRADGWYSMFAGGGSAMYDRDRFVQIGGFEPLLAPFYWEDVELSYRAWKRGYKVAYEPRSIARHQLSSTIGKLDQRKVRRIQQRNRLMYHWIHLHDPGMLASHVAWSVLLGLTAPLRFKPDFLSALIDALKRLAAIRQRRRREKQAAKISDRELFLVFRELEAREDLMVYDEPHEAGR